MTKQDTKQLIVNTFRENVRNNSYSKIRIATLIEECGISRTAFYYHFTNKLAIARFIFFTGLSAHLKDALPESKLIPCPDHPNENLAYYVHNEVGAHALDASEFYRAISLVICEDPSFYKGLVANGNREFLDDLCHTYGERAKDDVRFILGGRRMSEPEQDLLSFILSRSIVNSVEYAIGNPAKISEITEFNSNVIWNATHESLRNVIESRLSKRSVRQPF